MANRRLRVMGSIGRLLTATTAPHPAVDETVNKRLVGTRASSGLGRADRIARFDDRKLLDHMSFWPAVVGAEPGQPGRALADAGGDHGTVSVVGHVLWHPRHRIGRERTYIRLGDHGYLRDEPVTA